MRLVFTTLLTGWSIVLTTWTCSGAVGTTTNESAAPLFKGVVTLVQPQRGLVVLQDQTNSHALSLDLSHLALRLGDYVQVEGESSLSYRPTITLFSDYPDRPSGREWRRDFIGPTNWGKEFICRMRGFIHPPETGSYRFWIAGDDESELWLSSDSNPARARKIAFVPVPGWTLPGQWSKYSQQQSEPVFLEKNGAYYIEAVQVQHRGEDNLSVAWKGPELERSVITGQYLSPWLEGIDVTRVADWPKAVTNGILREYWTNKSVWRGLDLTGRTPQESIVKIAAPRMEILGRGTQPSPLPISIGQILPAAEDFRWAEVEGVLDFAAINGKSLVLELTDGEARMQVRILDWSGDALPRIVNSRVKLQGVCEAVRNEKGEAVAGLLWVPQAREIPLVKPTRTKRLGLRPTRLADLASPPPDSVAGQKVRVGGRVVETSPDGSFVIEDQGCFYGYVSQDGTNWVQLGNAVEIPMSNSVCVGLAVCSCTNGVLNTAVFQAVIGLSAAAKSDGVGDILKTGMVKMAGADITMSGSGTDITLRRDSFQFLHESLNGDGEIVARVNSLQDTAARGWARAGVMIRESLSPNSKFVMVSQTARAGAFWQYRINNDALAEGLSAAAYHAPTWVKLVRRHNRVRVMSADGFMARLGQSLDIIGFPDVQRDGIVLKHAFSEESAEAATLEGPRHDMQLVSQFTDVSIRRLLVGPYLTSEGLRLEGIRVQGTVTFNGRVSGKNYLFVQDETGAIAVNVDRFDPAVLPSVGQRVRVAGQSMAGKYAPAIDPLQIEALGWGELPAPVTRSVAFSSESYGDGVWIELSGVVHNVGTDGMMEIATPEGPMRVWINQAATDMHKRYLDAVVRLRGVLSLTLSPDPLLLVPSPDYVETVESGPADPFAGPLRSITDLWAFNPRIQMIHRVRIAGTVTWRQGEALFLENKLGAVRIQTAAATDVNVGDEAEVVGFPERGAHIPWLTQAIVRKKDSTGVLLPASPSEEDLFAGRFDGRLIRLDAEMLEQRSDKDRQVLELQVGHRIIEAVLPADTGLIARIRAGSFVGVTGVCRWESGVPGGEQTRGTDAKPGVVEILLRGPADVQVLHNPPWWTVRRVMILIGTLLGVLLASAVWIHTLRRRVATRSRQLEAATARLAEETRNAAVLAERQRLAGEIHDSLQQGFTGIRLQLDAANSKLAEGPDAVRRYLNTAQSMIQYSLAEVKSALWNWQSPLLKEADLVTALSSIAKQIGAVSQTRIEFELSGQPQPLSATVEHHLLRIGQEGITNAIKHADAKTIRVILDYSATAVRLTIRDDGRGFVSEKALDERGTHFGLSGLIGRARKLGTQLIISSEPGKGTSLVVVVPLGELSKSVAMPGNDKPSSN